jgi:hypothetical protein
MKLHRQCDVTPDGTGFLCRQGRLAGTINATVLSTILIGATVFWWRVNAPWFVWGLCGLVSIVLVPMILGDAIAKFRSTNWLVWIRPDGLWINFCSYQDQGPKDTHTIVQFNYREIAEAFQITERYTESNGQGRTNFYTLKSLDLRLGHGDTQDLQSAIGENRRRTPTPQSYFGGIHVTTRPTQYPVSLPEDDLIRIQWRGKIGLWVAPNVSKALDELSKYVKIAEPARLQRKEWREMTDEEFDAKVLELVQAGSRMDAINLLIDRRGFSTTEAHQFVEKLACLA